MWTVLFCILSQYSDNSDNVFKDVPYFAAMVKGHSFTLSTGRERTAALLIDERAKENPIKFKYRDSNSLLGLQRDNTSKLEGRLSI